MRSSKCSRQLSVLIIRNAIINTKAIRLRPGPVHVEEKYNDYHVQSEEFQRSFAAESGDSKSNDAIGLSKGQAENLSTTKQESNAQPSSGGFQPGQMGDQVSSLGKSSADRIKGTKEAARIGLGDAVKKGLGERCFHTSTQSRSPGPPYWTPAVPTHDVMPSQSLMTVSTSRPRAAFTYVRGLPEPDSYKRYTFVPPPNHQNHDPTLGLPSSKLRSSSTSTDPAHPQTDNHPSNPAGVGSSSKIVDAQQGVDIQSESGPKRRSAAKNHKTRLPPDFNTEAKRKWQPQMDKGKHEGVRPPAGDKPALKSGKG